MMKIPIFKLDFENDFIREYQDKCRDIFTSNRPLTESNYVTEFENKFSVLVGSKYSIAVSNGTAAIDVALRALNIKGKVIIPSNTFFVSFVAVENAGCEIVLVECEKNSFSIDVESLSEKLRTNDIEAVIVVHIGGIISKDIDEIKKLCNEYDIPLIEDAAHAHCSKRGRYRAGTIGDIGCFSFFPTKVMTTGEGGMVTTNNKELYEKCKSIKNFGRDINNSGVCSVDRGINYKINEFTGLLGSMECDRVINRINKRNRLVVRYVENLKGSLYTPVLQDSGYCSYYKFITRITLDREKLRTFCKDNNITLTGEVYNTPIHLQPLYIDRFSEEDFGVTEEVCKYHICPPLYPELHLDEIDYICDVLLRAEKSLAVGFR
jgi:perosamine synthetase